MKWNSSSNILQYLQFLSFLGILFVLCHLPVNSSKSCAETLNLGMYIRYLTIFILSKYVLKLKSEIYLYVGALEDVCKLLFQCWIQLSLTLCLNKFKHPIVSPTLCNTQTSLTPVGCSICLTCSALFDLGGYVYRLFNIILQTCFIYFLSSQYITLSQQRITFTIQWVFIVHLPNSPYIKLS